MPTYPYACTACGHAFEVQQSFSDPSLTECPECAGRLRKVFSSVGVVFKGSGFYRTDSRSGSTGSGTSGGTSTAPSSDGGSAATSGKGAAAKESTGTASPPATTSPAASAPAAGS